jgi:DNA (cytosine-5)-methyltransferase 1
MMQAIDLYSGIGGWAVGLKLAGIEVIESYERSVAANETNSRNNGHRVVQADLRSISPESFPQGVAAVVGSPPCTQFSFSNRGGSGDLLDGLADIASFLRTIDHLKPQVWAMENVPRLATIIETELRPGGMLAEFSHLGIKHAVFDLEEFGVAQKRKRCIVGNFDLALLDSYRSYIRRRSLGEVIECLQTDPVIDPNFSYSIPASDLYDHIKEEPLDSEEVRINRSLKVLHPIYNAMQFPDRLDRTARTITATCTRVSRESIVIASQESRAAYRRLTIRERACCQGFPISFQFYADSYSEKLKMVGNAIPPLFAYYVAHAMRGTRADEVADPTFKAGDFSHIDPPPICGPNRRKQRYRADRSFQFAIPSLHLKSGVRFELNNGTRNGPLDWHVQFVFGTSKDIRAFRPDIALIGPILERLPQKTHAELRAILDDFSVDLDKMDFTNLQSVWSHRGPGSTRPFMLLDAIDNAARRVQESLSGEIITAQSVRQSIQILPLTRGQNLSKLLKHPAAVIGGLLIGGLTNEIIGRKLSSTPSSVRQARTRRVG